MKKHLGAIVILVVAQSARAGFVVNCPAGLISSGPVGNVGNGVCTFNYSGPEFTVGNIIFEGDLTSGGTGTWASEARFNTRNPPNTPVGGGNTPQLTALTNFTGTIHIGPTTINAAGFFTGTTIGLWQFEAFESFNDPGNDATWSNLTIIVQDFVPPPPPPVAVDLGFIYAGTTSGSAPLSAGVVRWFKFVTTVPIASPNWLTADTLGSNLPPNAFGPNDTEVGVYSAAGVLLSTNDDIAPFGNLMSQVNFGTPPLPQGAAPVATLAAGTYYAAVSSFDTIFASGFSVTSTGTVTGTVQLNINTDIPQVGEECDPNGNCVAAPSGSCEQVQYWSCDPVTCQCTQGTALCRRPDGTYATQAECQLACSGCIPPRVDCWRTEQCGATQFDFSDTPLPPDFFEPGSEAFTGTVRLGGDGQGNHDTGLRRLQAMNFPTNYPATAQSALRMEELHLVSCEPIGVRVSNAQGENVIPWDVEVGLSTQGPPPPDGMINVTKTYDNGGTFTADFYVQPVFTFRRVGDPNDMRVLDTGAEGLPPRHMASTSPGSWVHQLEPGIPATPCGENFVPGVMGLPDLLGRTHTQCCRPVTEADLIAFHAAGVFTPPNEVCTPCPHGACCDPQTPLSCTVAFDRAECEALGRIYMGDNTTCNDSDRDGIPDVMEVRCCTVGCCSPTNYCNPGTDPRLCDTDGDGVSDGDEVLQGTNPCEVPDCNNNGQYDDCDIANGTSRDCNKNGVPDECEFVDCNQNGVNDACDILDGTSLDCDKNLVPDDCQPDCNNNGVADPCDIANRTSEDCNNNTVPDECDITSGTSQDCQPNGHPDECDIALGAGGGGTAAPPADEETVSAEEAIARIERAKRYRTERGGPVGGPVLIGGDDSDDHGFAQRCIMNDGWLYIQKALDLLGSQVNNGNNVAVCLGATAWAAQAFESAFDESKLLAQGWTRATLPGVNQITGFFDGSGQVNINNAGIIYLPTDQVNTVGGIGPGQMAVVNSNASALNTFVANGGGLFTHDERYVTGGYGWLRTLVPVLLTSTNDCMATPGCQFGQLSLTPIGQQAFPGLTNAIISNATPWHTWFESRLCGFSGLRTLVEGQVGAIARPVILGGANIQLQQRIDLCPLSAVNTVGTPHTVIAYVINTAGQSLPDVTVTFDVVFGPNAGVTGTATTDPTGLAPFTYTGGPAEGTDEIMARFVEQNQTYFSNVVLKKWQRVGSQDCDKNGIPDECQLDCDGDGVADACDPVNAIEVTIQPKAATACAGETASFSAVVSGPGPFSYRWRKNVTPLADGGNVFGATTSTLVLDPVSPLDNGLYSVVVTGPCSQAISPCKGDMDDNGVANLADMPAFVLALLNDILDPCADLTEDNRDNGLDIQPFIDLVLADGGSGTPVGAELTVQSCCAPLPSNLVSWWPAEGNATDIWDGNPGMLLGTTTFVPGKVGQAFHFDSDDDGVTIPDAPNLHQTTQLTVEFWIKAAQVQDGAYSQDRWLVLDKSHAEATGWAFQGHRFDTQELFFIVSDGTAFYGEDAGQGAVVNDDLWHHIAGTVDGTFIRLYVDGQLEGETPFVGPIAQNGRAVNLGFHYFENRHFRGSIDELSLYDRALSQAEIQAIFAAGSAGKCPP